MGFSFPLTRFVENVKNGEKFKGFEQKHRRISKRVINLHYKNRVELLTQISCEGVRDADIYLDFNLTQSRLLLFFYTSS